MTANIIDPPEIGKSRKHVIRVGDRFGRLQAIGLGDRSQSGRMTILCLCDCGAEKQFLRSNLARNHTMSCGCLKRVRPGGFGPRPKSAALAASLDSSQPILQRIAKTYLLILARLRDRTGRNRKNYSGREIFLSPHWIGDEGFWRFAVYVIVELGEWPGPGWSIDRIDNNRGYEEGNIRWSPHKRQGRNTRRNQLVAYKDEVITIAEAAERTGLGCETIHSRIRSGWPPEDLFIPASFLRRHNRAGM